MSSEPLALYGKEYLALPREAETFVISPLLPTGGAMTVYGDPKVGKSFIAIQIALSILRGQDWLGFPVTTRGEVLYVQLDTPRSLWLDRLNQLADNGFRDLDNLIFTDRDQLDTWPFDILNPDHFEKLQLIVAQHRPLVTIIDTIKESHQVNENDATEMQKVIAALTAATQPSAMILIHHGRKPNSEHPDTLLAGSRGSSYLMGKMDAIVHLSKKSCHYTGRAIEEGSLRLERLENGLWAAASHETDNLITNLLTDSSLSQREVARKVAEATGRGEEAARSLIRRHRERSRAAKPKTEDAAASK